MGGGIGDGVAHQRGVHVVGGQYPFFGRGHAQQSGFLLQFDIVAAFFVGTPAGVAPALDIFQRRAVHGDPAVFRHGEAARLFIGLIRVDIRQRPAFRLNVQGGQVFGGQNPQGPGPLGGDDGMRPVLRERVRRLAGPQRLAVHGAGIVGEGDGQSGFVTARGKEQKIWLRFIAWQLQHVAVRAGPVENLRPQRKGCVGFRVRKTLFRRRGKGEEQDHQKGT